MHRMRPLDALTERATTERVASIKHCTSCDNHRSCQTFEPQLLHVAIFYLSFWLISNVKSSQPSCQQAGARSRRIRIYRMRSNSCDEGWITKACPLRSQHHCLPCLCLFNTVMSCQRMSLLGMRGTRLSMINTATAFQPSWCSLDL